MHKAIGIKLSELSFPSEEFNEEKDPITRRCTYFGEAAIMIANDSNVFGKTNFFKCFYNGFTEDSTIWFAYHDDNKEYENPFKFNLDSWKNDEEATNIMREAMSPRILPANFTSGKSAIGYEFCYPSKPGNWDLSKYHLSLILPIKFRQGTQSAMLLHTIG